MKEQRTQSADVCEEADDSLKWVKYDRRIYDSGMGRMWIQAT